MESSEHAPGQPAPAPTSLRAADVLIDQLIAHGVDTLFTLPGGPIGSLLDALIDRPQIRVVQPRSEGAAVFAAAGYACATGRLGVALVTSGPGALNALTALTSAQCDGLPVLLLVGEVARRVHGRGALQDGSAYALRMVEILRTVTKYAEEVNDPNRAAPMLRYAIRTALTGPEGPVALTLPIDVTLASVEVSPGLKVGPVAPAPPPEPRPDALAAVEAALRDAGRGVLFIGAGVRRGDGPRRLLELADRLQWPVMTTPKGKGVFPEHHPLSLGVFGMGGHVSACDYVEAGIDTMLAVGTSLGELATDGWNPAVRPARNLVHVDVDERQFGRSYPSTINVVSSAERFFAEMTARLPQAAWQRYGVKRRLLPLGTGLPMHAAIAEMQMALPRHTIYTVDSGEHFVFATHYLRITEPDSFVVMTGLGSMGQSIPAAIGAQLARPERVVAAICGDGCFAMNAFEIASAVSGNLPIIVFVINDGRLGMVEIGNTIVYGRTLNFATGPLNVSQIASGLGAQTLVAAEFGAIRDTDFMSLRKRGPVVVDVRIDPTVKLPKRDRFISFNTQSEKRVA